MIDTHAHLFLCGIGTEELLSNARRSGVTHIVCPALDVPTSRTSRELARKFPMVSATLGIHPAESGKPYDLDELRSMLREGGFAAIGEIGLDYYRNYESEATQKKVFEEMLTLARENDLPAIIHNRSAEQDVIVALQKFPDVRRVVHCFSSDRRFAKEIMTDGTMFSFTATITYAKRGEALEVLAELPMDKIMIETDSPYLLPASLKSESKEMQQENQPANVGEVAKKIAEIRNISLDEVIQATTRNAKKFFRL